MATLKLYYTPSNVACRVDQLVERWPKRAWTRTTIAEGSTGPLMGDVVMVGVMEARDGLPGPRLWLIRRRHVADPSAVRYYQRNAPQETTAAELARLLGMRWSVELTVDQGTHELGRDADEVRSSPGWHHHMLMGMLAIKAGVELTRIADPS